MSTKQADHADRENDIEELDTEEEFESEELDEDESESEGEEETELDEDLEDSEGDDDNDDAEPEDEGDESADSDEDDLVITIGEQEPEKEAPQDDANWLKNLRKSHRELKKENRELRKRVAVQENPVPKTQSIGPKPKLEDFDYDEDKFEPALVQWHEKKRQVQAEEDAAKTAQKEASEAWERQLAKYNEAKAKLRVRDFEDAEEEVLNALDPTQQGIIVDAAENPELVVYALGKNPERLRKLSEIKSPVRFASAIGKLETELKVRSRKSPPPPERRVNGSGGTSINAKSKLDRLREEAAKTGDFSKVIAERQRQKAKQRATKR